MSPFLVWGDFHACSRFARPTIPEEKWGTTRSLGHSLPQLVGNLSNHNGDVKKKTTGLITRRSTLHMHHAFFVHYLVVTARLQHETFQCDVFKL